MIAELIAKIRDARNKATRGEWRNDNGVVQFLFKDADLVYDWPTKTNQWFDLSKYVSTRGTHEFPLDDANFIVIAANEILPLCDAVETEINVLKSEIEALNKIIQEQNNEIAHLY